MTQSECSECCECDCQIMETIVTIHKDQWRIIYIFGYFDDDGREQKIQDQIRFETNDIYEIKFPSTPGCPDNCP